MYLDPSGHFSGDYVSALSGIVREYVFYVFLKIQKNATFYVFLKQHFKKT